MDTRALLSILQNVEKPARYLGGEVNEIRKDWDAVDVHAALMFPDMYEVAMSHLGLRILYDIINKRPDTLCERAYAVWPDLEAELRRHGLPLFTLESKRPLADFDLIGVTLQYELSYPSVLAMLELGGIPIWAKDRTDAHPIILGGGPSALSPEPVAEFFDAFLVGEGEEAIHEILDAIKRTMARAATLHWRRSPTSAASTCPSTSRPAMTTMASSRAWTTKAQGRRSSANASSRIWTPRLIPKSRSSPTSRPFTIACPWSCNVAVCAPVAFARWVISRVQIGSAHPNQCSTWPRPRWKKLVKKRLAFSRSRRATMAVSIPCWKTSSSNMRPKWWARHCPACARRR